MKIEEMQPGQGGYTDPWNLAEVQRFVTPYMPTMEPGERIPPAPDPRTGMYQLYALGEVEPAPTSDHYMPVSRDRAGAITIDLAGVKLNHPPRLESTGQLAGRYLPVMVLGMAEALRPPAVPVE